MWIKCSLLFFCIFSLFSRILTLFLQHSCLLSHDHKINLLDFRDTANFFDNCRRSSYPGASRLLQALSARSSSVLKVPNKHRRGRQVTLRSQSLRKLSLPSQISLNARSLLNKFDDLRRFLLSGLYHNTGVILVQ